MASGRAPGPILFTAPRGLGKTVLLRHLRNEAAAAGFVVVWVTATASESLINALITSVRAAIRDNFEGRFDDLIARLDSFKVTAGVPGVLQLEAASRPGESHKVSFSTEMAVLARRLRERNARGLMLFVDELQSAPSEDLAALAPALQEWTASGEQVPVMFVGAGPNQLSRVLAAQGGFAERFKYVPLERLGGFDSMAALTLGLPGGFRWLPGALEAAVQAAAGHPYVLQLICHYAWEASDASVLASPFFSIADIDLAVERARQEIKRVFEGRWAETPDEHRGALAALATSADGRLTRAQIASAAGLAMRDVELAVDALYANGWLDVDGLEQVRIGLPGIHDFILRRTT